MPLFEILSKFLHPPEKISTFSTLNVQLEQKSFLPRLSSKMGTVSAKKQWLLSLVVVVSLAIGSSLMFHLDKVLVKFFTKISGNPAIDFKESAALAGLEMGIIPVFAVFALAIVDKWSFKQIASISWKVFIIGAILGILIGSTYSLNYQSLTCGILH